MSTPASNFPAVLAEDTYTTDMTNGAAIGYMIMAARNIELEPDMIRALAAMMQEKMDFCSEDQAERAFMTFY